MYHGAIYARFAAGRDKLGAVAVVSKLAEHGNIRTKAAHLHGLIGALAARSLAKALAKNGLSGAREHRCGHYLIHYKAAYDQDFGSVFHDCPPN